MSDLDEFEKVKRFGEIGQAPFSVSQSLRSIDLDWSDDLLSTGLVVEPRYWTPHPMPGPESAIRVGLVLGGYMTLVSKIDDPMITVQIKDGPEEKIHKDMLSEYLMRNV